MRSVWRLPRAASTGPPLPHDDTEGWKRLQAAQPIALKHVGTQGAEMSPENPHVGYTYPYPILVTNADQDADEVYALIKGIHENFDAYKDSAPGADGWSMDNQSMVWGIPYHEGAIRFFKEQGMWTDEAQANHETLLKRQKLIKDAWDSMGSVAGMSPEEVSAKWMPIRAKALEDAGLPVVFN
ncbi:TAXI family TRAP transporter solute-binding subunit [Minwuia thermotolerans]|uniref:C4-dicarboxylate ABC transporter substrate-binding protein n=1 Tax=Minwuia thermotolerans TaxID=2056226 RepID=A0A2M9G3M2_9PROT|nr:TAXI family TRAP transporter solute-binding subunit [Minwuia thermotolerans]PJK30290.1 hypothetical protein CVT23_07860 [Minwuia thermotolerans]